MWEKYKFFVYLTLGILVLSVVVSVTSSAAHPNSFLKCFVTFVGIFIAAFLWEFFRWK